MEGVYHPIADYHDATLPRGEDGGSSPRLPPGLVLLLVIHGPQALHPYSKHLGVEAPHSLSAIKPVLFLVPYVCFVSFVVQAPVHRNDFAENPCPFSPASTIASTSTLLIVLAFKAV